MKTCPKCGAKMKSDVNYCTNCGAYIAKVPLDNIDEESPSFISTEDSSSAVVSLTIWQWLIASWKHPFGEQDAYKWYGWITLVVKDVLVALGLFFGSLRASSSLLGNDIASNTAGFTFGMAIELVFLLLLTEAAWIGAAYLAYKVIYEKSKNFLQFTNHVVQTSNLSEIFISLFFLLMIFGGTGGIVLSVLMISLSISFLTMALNVVVLEDTNPVHDKFYGYLLFLLLQAFTGIIMGVLIFSTVLGQISSSIMGIL